MKSFGTAFLLVLLLTSASPAQGLVDADMVAATRSKTIILGDGSGLSNPIWDNTSSLWGYWGHVETGYINLDWGWLPTGHHPFLEQVIDGFAFCLGSNNVDPAGETFSVTYFDQCTGWGSTGVQQAGFLFTGLPNGYGLPALSPGYGWIWIITVDLAGSGYEFPLDPEFGQGLSRWSTPTMGFTGLGIAGPELGSENAFDIYYPNSVYNGTWFFGSTNWAAWPETLYGPGEAPAAGMTYYGEGCLGNEIGLYTIGDWTMTVHFMLTKHGWDKPGYLLASRTWMLPPIYYPDPWDVTRLIGPLAGGSPWLMADDAVGDFCRYFLTVPSQYHTTAIYFQGIVTDMNPPVPCEMSNAVHS